MGTSRLRPGLLRFLNLQVVGTTGLRKWVAQDRQLQERGGVHVLSRCALDVAGPTVHNLRVRVMIESGLSLE